MPFTDGSVITKLPAARTRNPHPHPLRSHYSAEDIMAEQTQQPEFNDIDPIPQQRRSIIFGRTRSGTIQRRSIHSSGDRSDEFQVFSTPQVAPAVFSAQERFGYTPGTYASTAPSKPDYPVIPTRPPLRPTVSFGSCSQASYDSSMWDEKIPAATERELELESRHGRNAWKFQSCFACLCLLNFVCAYATTALSTSLPYISGDLNLSALQIFWLPGAQLLATALVQPLFMRLSVAIPSKPTFLFSLTLFAIGTIVSATAKQSFVILLGQAIQGIGIGVTSILTQSTIDQLLASNERSKLKEYRSFPSWTGLAIAPIVGGALTQTLGWRSIFYTQLCLSIIAAATVPWLFHLSPILPVRFTRTGITQIDYLGWLLLAGGATALVVPLSFGGILHSWSSYQTLVPLFFGASMLIIWILHSRSRPTPIIPISIFRNASACVSMLGALVNGALIMAAIYLLPIFYKLSVSTPLIGALLLTPWTFGIVVTSLITTHIIRRSGYRITIWLGWALVALSLGLMIVLTKSSAHATLMLPITLVGGVAIGTLIPSLCKAIQSAASNDDEIINANALNLFFHTLGQCLGILLGNTIFLNCLKSQIFSNPTFTIDAQQFWTYAYSTLGQLNHLDSRIQENLILNFTDSLRPVWIAGCIAAGVLLFLSVWFTEDHHDPRPRHEGLVELE